MRASESRYVALVVAVAAPSLVGVAVVAQPDGDLHHGAVRGGGSQRDAGKLADGLRNLAGCPAVFQRANAEPGRELRRQPTKRQPPRDPTIVGVTLFILEVTEVAEVENTFTVEGLMDGVWCDERRPDAVTLVESSAAKALEQRWSPDLAFVNGVGPVVKENEELIIDAAGTVEYRERFSATLEARYDLRCFPFDKQRLRMELESFAWPAKNFVSQRRPRACPSADDSTSPNGGQSAPTPTSGPETSRATAKPSPSSKLGSTSTASRATTRGRFSSR